MRQLFILIAVLVYSNALSSQSLGPVQFEGLTTLWNHEVIDSNRWDGIGDIPTSYFLTRKSINNESYIYTLFSDEYEYYDGFHIECRERSTGQLIWWDYQGDGNIGINIDPTELRFNENGDIEVICFRELYSPLSAGIQRNCQPNVFIYDHLDGSILQDLYESTYDNVDSLYWFRSYTKIYSVDEGYMYLFYNKEGDERSYQKMYFDDELTFTRKDTFRLPIDYASFTYNTPKETIGSKSFVNFRYSSERTLLTPADSLFDIFSLYLDRFDSNFEYIESIDVADKVPYNWSFDFPFVFEDEIMIQCRDSVDIPGTQFYFAQVFFDNEGNYLRTVDFGNYDLDQYRMTQLPDKSGYLYITENTNYETGIRTIDFFRSDNAGALTKLSSFDLKPSYRMLLRGLDVLDENQVNLLYHNLYFDSLASRTYLDNHVWTSFSAADIGLELTSTEEVDHDLDIPYFTISPNPSSGISTITLSDRYTGYITISDIQGRELQRSYVHGVQEYMLSIPQGSSQTYLVTLEGADGKIRTEQWVVR